jgi:hypothetical protein
MRWFRSACRSSKANSWPGPLPPWADIDPGLARQLAAKRPAAQKRILRDVVEPAATAGSTAQAAAAFAANPALQSVVLVGDHLRPIAVLDAGTAELGVVRPGMRVNLDTPLAEALARSMTRMQTNRFEPLLITDNAGRFAGIARLERMITVVAAEREA